MSRKRLFRYVIAACVWLVLFASSYGGSVYYETAQMAAAIKDLFPLVVALPAAFLAYAFAFSRHNSYLQALRELWKQLVPSVQKAVQYTYGSSSVLVERVSQGG